MLIREQQYLAIEQSSMTTIYAQATPVCQLDCLHCHVAYDEFYELTPQHILDMLSSLQNKHYPAIKIVWTGGEPILLGIDKFKRLLNLLNLSDILVYNVLHTNLVMYAVKHLDFFREYFDSNIIVSIDPVLRIFPGALGDSLPVVLENIERAQEDGIKITAQFTLTKPFFEHFPTLDNFFLFLSQNNLTSIRLALLQKNGRASENWSRISPEPSFVASWLRQLHTCLLKDSRFSKYSIYPISYELLNAKNLSTQLVSNIYTLSSSGFRSGCPSCDTEENLDALCFCNNPSMESILS